MKHRTSGLVALVHLRIGLSVLHLQELPFCSKDSCRASRKFLGHWFTEFYSFFGIWEQHDCHNHTTAGQERVFKTYWGGVAIALGGLGSLQPLCSPLQSLEMLEKKGNFLFQFSSPNRKCFSFSNISKRELQRVLKAPQTLLQQAIVTPQVSLKNPSLPSCIAFVEITLRLISGHSS